MLVSDLATIVREMKGHMPESSRVMLVFKILKILGLTLRKRDAILLEKWHKDKAPEKFISDCDLPSDVLPSVPWNASLGDSKLAEFFDKWTTCSTYQNKPLTPEMESIKSEMLEELKGLSNATMYQRKSKNV